MKYLTIMALLLSGCAYTNMPTPEAQITGTYVSSAKYENYDCQKLRAEFDSVSRREVQIKQAQIQRVKVSQQQAVWFGYGMGDGFEASELANLRGEKEALRKNLEYKACDI